jgi:ribonuclease T1
MYLKRMSMYYVERTVKLLLIPVAILLLAAMPAAADARRAADDHAAHASVSLSDLPGEARTTYQLIRQGGPFPYKRDGVVFGNYERRLPAKPRGYYHEYTVKTPGVRHRGARRIVCGQPVECYYSDDHYETFKRIRE